MIETSQAYVFICDMFDDGWEAKEVIELCLDCDMPIQQAQIYTQYYITKHERRDVFEIDQDPDICYYFSERQYAQWAAERAELEEEQREAHKAKKEKAENK